MKPGYLILMACVVGFLMVGSAGAHEVEYSGTSDAHYYDGCNVTPGVVCYGGLHILPDANGLATVTIADDVNPTVSGFVCQDLGGDLFCGGAGELAEPFCIEGTIEDLDHGGLWEPEAYVRVFVDGPIRGDPLTSLCGPVYSGGSHGYVTHT